MEKASIRSLTSQLADDLSWLENHGRAQPELAMQAGALRLAAASVRNVIGPFLEGQGVEPLHLAVVGGAGAGKSTIANFLSGSILAEANPQAGFTRHPIAYASSNGPANWSAHVGFLGPLRRLTVPTPSNLDEDVYQVRRVPVAPEQFSLLDHVIVWDCPDMTAEASTNYIHRMLEAAGLADIVVYVASDERYNDEVETRFLRLLLQAGKTVVVVITKMKPEESQALLDLFQKEVLTNNMPGKPVACLAVPHLTREQQADPVKKAGQYRIPLINQIGVFTAAAQATRRRSVTASMNYLKNHQAELIGVARSDLIVLEDWKNLVMQGEKDFLKRYRREFLAVERFPRFDEALVRLLDLLEIPLPGFKAIGAVLRAPFKLIRGLFNKAMQRPDAPPLPERPVLEGALAGWTDFLRKEASRRAPTHPVWAHIDKGFADLEKQTRQLFDKNLKSFQQGMNEEVDRTARAIYEDLQKHPVGLNTLRGGKLAIEVGAIVLSFASLGMTYIMWNILLVPVAAAVTQQLVELLGKQYVEFQRERARARQEAMVAQVLANPQAELFIKYPTSGGSAFEELQNILRRLPESVTQLDLLVQEKLKEH